MHFVRPKFPVTPERSVIGRDVKAWKLMSISEFYFVGGYPSNGTNFLTSADVFLRGDEEV